MILSASLGPSSASWFDVPFRGCLSSISIACLPLGHRRRAWPKREVVEGHQHPDQESLQEGAEAPPDADSAGVSDPENPGWRLRFSLDLFVQLLQ